MLPRSQRLSNEQLEGVMEKGRVAHSSLFLVRAVEGQKSTRVAAVVPKKVAKTAVERNRLRRRIYEVVRALFPKIPAGLHVAIFAKQPLRGAESGDIAADIHILFSKARLTKAGT